MLRKSAFLPLKLFQTTKKGKLSRIVPYFLPMGGSVPVRQTSSTHGPDGYITNDSDKIAKNQDRLNNKLKRSVKRFSFHSALIEDNARTMIITYGVTSRAAIAVFNEQKKKKEPGNGFAPSRRQKTIIRLFQ